ncbi:MAG: hypothetical protein LQ345_005207 [Seirophora villosa]|nr:MAG: hypothetical protein LQ345_005207 [Seirophora villosa]
MPDWSEGFIRKADEMRLPAESWAKPKHAKPSTVTACPSWSFRVEQKSQLRHFPLMQLPAEIRGLIFGEILRPTGRDHHDSTYNDHGPDNQWKQRRTWIEEQEVLIKDAKHRANLLATSKQVNAEASAAWFKKQYVKAEISGYMAIGSNRCDHDSVLTMPTYLPQVRNIHIHLERGELLSVKEPFLVDRGTIKHLERFCYELAANSGRLTNIVFEIPCICALCEHEKSQLLRRPLTAHESSCLPAEEFEQLLKPLERLRASRSIKLKSNCRNAAEYQRPIFSRLAAVVTSSEPVKELEGNELIWWKLQERARPFMKGYRSLRKLLHSVHVAADIQMWINIRPEDKDYPQKFLGSATSDDQKHALKIAYHMNSFRTAVQRLETVLDDLESEAARLIPGGEDSDEPSMFVGYGQLPSNSTCCRGRTCFR